MADFNLKDDLLGFSRSQLKYMLLHNADASSIELYGVKKGLFYYDTTSDIVKLSKDNSSGWNTILTSLSSNNGSYNTNYSTINRLLVGDSTEGNIKGFNTGSAGFLKVSSTGIPSIQSKILFEDIEPTDYTTVILEPGVNTRFVTEKAVVDYVNSTITNPSDYLLKWDTGKYKLYTAKQSPDPGYMYLYNTYELPDFAYWNRFLSVAGSVVAHSLFIGTYNANSLTQIYGSDIKLQRVSDNSHLQLNYDVATNKINIFSTTPSASGPDMIIGTSPTGYGNRQYITLSDTNSKFTFNYTTINIATGTADRYLYLDSNKNITYVTSPAASLVAVDDILDWSTDKYTPYTSKTASALYTGVSVPTLIATILNYDGVFRATQLYEGSTRVMTTHGSWAEDGTLHAVTTTSNAGFCPQLPLVATSTTFLRADGSWVDIDSLSLWARDGVNNTLYTVIPGDSVLINTESKLAALTIGETSTTDNIFFGIRDIGDNQPFSTAIGWYANGAEQNLVTYMGIFGTNGVDLQAKIVSNIDFWIESGILYHTGNEIYSSGYKFILQNSYLGTVSIRSFNSASTSSSEAAASFIAGVYPSTADYSTINLTVTGLNYAGETNWSDNGSGYLVNSANIVTGGQVKPALNIGTREGKPIRFFVGGDLDTDFDTTTLRMVINKDGFISIGNHSGIGTDVAMYQLDILSNDIRLVRGGVYFGGTTGLFDATSYIIEESPGILVTDSLFKAPTARFGSDINYTEIEADGTIKFVGDATVYDDINLSGSALTPGGSAAPGFGVFRDGNLAAYVFDGDSLTERLYGSIEMKHNYKEGSDIEFHIHWSPTTTSLGNVVWQVYYSWANSGEVFAASTLVAATATAAGGTAFKSVYSTFGSISGVGKTINSQIVIQIFRDPTNIGDTYPNDAALIQFGIHYEIDTIGSRNTTTK